MRIFLKIKLNSRFFALGCAFILVCYVFGLDNYILEKDFESMFDYPLGGDIRLLINEIKDGQTPKVLPINDFDYKFLITPQSKCESTSDQTIRLLYVVKSAAGNFNHRRIIRNSWGFERRFSDVGIRTVFMLGNDPDSMVNLRVKEEAGNYNDIVKGDFVDSYFNNTIKSVLSMKWVTKNCMDAQYIMFVDDDMYVSTKNVLKFLRNPYQYPQYLKTAIISEMDAKIFDETYESGPDHSLYAGYVFQSSPLRQRFSKWYVSVEEYPYDRWPPYVTGGAFVVSRSTLRDLYLGCLYTLPFRLDDVYLGIVSFKVHIALHHVDEVYYYCNDVTDEFLLACHGFKDPKQMLSVWQQQLDSGHA